MGGIWLDTLGWGGSALLVFSLLQSRVLRFRVLNLVACVLLMVFNALIGVWPMVGMNLVLTAINVWFIVKLVRERHDEAAFEVVEVAPTDGYLRHVLGVYADDIRRFNPGLAWDPSRPGALASLVQQGDQTVCVVLLYAEGDIARVQLDFVTRAFRDFSPGEFVWRRSGLLREHGLARVVTPLGMVGAYYDRLGFTRVGDSYELVLANQR